MTPERFSVELPAGTVEVSCAAVVPAGAWAAVAIAHGAGAGMDHPFLVGFADALADEGLATLRFTFPYVEAGRRMPGPAGHATATWRAAMAVLSEAVPGVPAVAAGKSYGGRMASMAAASAEIDPAALVYLGYPLHPPGHPEKLRAEHLGAIAARQLFLSGTSDPFVQPADQLERAVAACQAAHLQWIDGGGHSFEVKGRKRPADEIGAALGPVVAAWLRDTLVG